MTLTALVNGAVVCDSSHAIALNDRGLHYGDGLFETMALTEGCVRYLEDHLKRLTSGCERLRIPTPDRQTLLAEIEQATARLRTAVVKIILTRGVGARGYRPDPQTPPTRVVAAYAAPEIIKTQIVADWRATRLARNAQLAGLKHLNRLEQVLAQAEQTDPSVDEGLMLDTEGELVCGTASNVFIVRDGALLTPDLRYCGVRGVMRAQVLRAAARIGIPVSETRLWPQDVAGASEMFVTNAVRGVRSVIAIADHRWPAGPIAQQLRETLLL